MVILLVSGMTWCGLMDHVSFTHKTVYGFLSVTTDSMPATQSPKRKVGTMCYGLKSGRVEWGLDKRVREWVLRVVCIIWVESCLWTGNKEKWIENKRTSFNWMSSLLDCAHISKIHSHFLCYKWLYSKRRECFLFPLEISHKQSICTTFFLSHYVLCW